MSVIPITVYFPVCDQCGWSPDDVGVGCARPEDATDLLDQHEMDRHEGSDDA